MLEASQVAGDWLAAVVERGVMGELGSLQEAAKRDTQHRIPKINHLLGVILAEKQDYSRAAENIRLYLKLSPNASDADTVRKLLADVETAAAQGIAH